MTPEKRQLTILTVFAAMLSCVLVGVIMLDSPQFTQPIFIIEEQGFVEERILSPQSSSITVLNINTASMEELDTLPGIGEITAQRIVEYRTQIGSFTRIEQLLEVERIGEKTLDKLRPYISLSK